MEHKDKIVAKINALLAKTTDNGASQAEMESALSMASKLMVQHFISEHDIKDSTIADKCVLKEVPISKMAYDVTLFYPVLAKLFDCKYYYNKKRIAFFGYKQDTELCAYFYSLIIRTCLHEVENFKKSENYTLLKNQYHGRTLISSFIKGFVIKVGEKMYEMYKNRESSLPPQYGLMISRKIKKVENEFQDHGVKIHTRKTSQEIRAELVAFDAGVQRGDSVNLIQGIEDKRSDLTLQLN